MNDDNFSFSYSAPTEEERREIESIKRSYIANENKYTKIEKLRMLDKKVKTPPTVVGLTVGIIGTLVLGVGMTMVLEWDLTVEGVIVGCIGTVIACLAYPIRNLILNINKKKYSKEILTIADEILEK